MAHIAATGQIGSWDENSEMLFRNRYPLHQSCRDGQVEVVSLLMERHSLLEEDIFYGWTPAHWASYFGRLDCLKKILNALPNNAGVDIKSSQFLQTPTHTACLAGQSDCLLWLLQRGTNINIQDYLGETPLHKACRIGNVQCVKVLLSVGAELCLLNNNGQSPGKLALTCFQPAVSAILDQAEFAKHQSNYMNLNGSFHSNAFNRNGMIQFAAPTNGHSPFTNGNGIVHRPTNGRKRSLDHFNDEVKRIRTEEIGVCARNCSRSI